MTTKQTIDVAIENGPLTLICGASGLELIEAANGDNGGEAMPRFSMVAYTGDAMRVDGWRYPVVVDLEGLSIPAQRRPIRFAHSAFQGVGHTERIVVEGGRLVAEGVISRDTPAAKEIVASGRRGFPWQASIGASVQKSELVRAGASVTVNGRVFEGPLYVARKASLGEISFVDLGADGNTSASIAAQIASGLLKKETNMDGEVTTPEMGLQAGAAGTIEAELAASRKRAADELRRQDKIRRVCGEKHGSIAAQAIEEGWTEEKTELEVLRASRPKTPGIVTGSGGPASADVLEAAVCQAARLDGIEGKFDEKTLDAAHTRFRGRLGLQSLIMLAAREGGYDGHDFKASPREALRAAFSTFSLPGILSNVANKFLLSGFGSVESSWRLISSIRNVSDFKRVTSYRLTGGMMSEEVSPGGELTYAAVGEESFGNQARTYGRIVGIDRTAIMNDDLGALTAIPQRLGRGAALKLNDVFWTAFMNNSTFFASGNKNFISGADTVLSIDSLTRAEQTFLDQTDSDGYPLGASPAILLVPNALSSPASQLMSSLEIRDTTANSKTATANPHAGKFVVVRSSYLANAKYTGSSARAWYLLASPNDLPVIEVAIVNGMESPTVETAEADFDSLGIRMRAYHDFGVERQDPRGGVKSKGEA